MVSLCNPGWAQFPKCWDYRSTPPGLSVSSHFFFNQENLEQEQNLHSEEEFFTPPQTLLPQLYFPAKFSNYQFSENIFSYLHDCK